MLSSVHWWDHLTSPSISQTVLGMVVCWKPFWSESPSSFLKTAFTDQFEIRFLKNMTLPWVLSQLIWKDWKKGACCAWFTVLRQPVHHLLIPSPMYLNRTSWRQESGGQPTLKCLPLILFPPLKVSTTSPNSTDSGKLNIECLRGSLWEAFLYLNPNAYFHHLYWTAHHTSNGMEVLFMNEKLLLLPLPFPSPSYSYYFILSSLSP